MDRKVRIGAIVAGVVVVALPILAFCGATILTLRGDVAKQTLTG